MLTKVTATQRDLRVLTFAAEQFGVPVPLVARLVARYGDRGRPLAAANAAKSARRTMRRLETSGWAERVRVRGEGWWLVPTRAGLRAAACEDEEAFELWQPGGWKLGHVAAAARLRLHLEDAYPGTTWESERRIRRRWAEAHRRLGLDTHTRYADGGLHLPDGGAVGVEVELGVKKLPLYQEIVRDIDPAWTRGCWWFTQPSTLALLAGRLRQAGAGDRHQARALPEGVGP